MYYNMDDYLIFIFYLSWSEDGSPWLARTSSSLIVCALYEHVRTMYELCTNYEA